MKKLVVFVLAFSFLGVLGHAQILKRPGSGSVKTVQKVAVYDEGKGIFVPSGWMGDVGAIKVEPKCAEKPKKGKYCMKWTYDISKDAKNGWAGVYWQYPANNWGTKSGLDLTGHKKLTFWAKGETGKEVINIIAGGIKGQVPDSFVKELKGTKLSSGWKQYTIDLSGRDLSNVSGGFCWTADSKLNKGAVTFYFDDILYE
ncbi:MAG: carbohydrate binding domain-containing protein [Candidatus Omnitrophica bacterium]|nr:carbohydrate binding domain-containing protein [Candidatus Omnitrophota bacterium]MDD5310606.1 carbohydrate binding domain-containing protein [Candidatus Omnitrophota bacterium]MDD5545610.1 carbohydrate binding domain-containing protein [Candidatus Omnitrophota bacterium]